jgi:tetratricopeptide (TPR) repeat protein
LAGALAAEPKAREEDQLELARMLAQHSRLKLHAGNNAEYIRLGDRSAAVFDAVLAHSPEHRRAGQALAVHYLSRGEYFMSLDTAAAPTLAQEALHKAVALLQRLHATYPDSTVLTHYLSIGRYTLGAALQRAGKPAQAATEHRAAIEMLAALTAQDPSSVPFRVDQATAYSNLGDALFSEGDVVGSINALQSAFVLLDRLPNDAVTLSMTRYRRGEAHYRWARALERRAEQAKACQHYRAALSDIRALASSVGPAELHSSTIEQALRRCS